MNRLAKTLLIGLMSLTTLITAGSVLLAAPQSVINSDIVAAETAAQLYAQGDYEHAAKAYEQLIDQGHADPVIYYNLGLAYEQSNDLGRAYWSLRNAEQLAPRDADVQTALAQVQSALTEVDMESALLATGSDSVLAQISTTSGHWLTLDELAWLSVTLWTVFALMLLTLMLLKPGSTVRRIAQVIAVSSGALLLVAMLGTGARMIDSQQPAAIVVADQVTLAAGPGAQYGGALALCSGSEVTMIDRRGDWVEVSADTTGGNLTGWLPVDSAAAIVSNNTVSS